MDNLTKQNNEIHTVMSCYNKCWGNGKSSAAIRISDRRGAEVINVSLTCIIHHENDS